MRIATYHLLILAIITQVVISTTNAKELNVPYSLRRSLKNKDPTPAPTLTPTSSPTSIPTPKPTLSPTRKPKNASKYNTVETVEDDDDEEPEETKAPIPAPTKMPVPAPTASPIISIKSYQAQTTIPPQVVATPLATPGPTNKPTFLPVATPTRGPTLAPTGGPTGGPSAGPTGGPTLAPTGSPTGGPTGSPTLAPTDGPTASPSAKPSRAPSKSPSASPTASPSLEPTASPSLQPSGAPSSAPSLSRHDVVLNEFNVLLTSDQGPVNIAELERSLETYMVETMSFDNLLRVKLNVVEGDSVTDSLGTFISTSVRFAGTATFTSQLPPSDDIRQEVSLVLNAKALMQTELHTNPVLAHATVQDVSFQRIESTRPFDELDAENKKDTKTFGFGMITIVAAIGVVTVLAVFGGVLVVRLRSVSKRRQMEFHPKEIPDDDSSIQPPSKTYPKKKNKKQEIGHGCASLVSGQVSLGNDSRLYCLPESLDDIVIRPMFSDDEDDDAYLTMDEELRDPYDEL